MIPQANCTLVEVAAREEPGDYGEATPGATLWTGARAAYYREIRERVSAGLTSQRVAQTSDLVITRSLIIEPNFPISIASGHEVTIEYGGEEIVAEVRKVERRFVENPPIPLEFQTTRLTLEDG